MMNRSLQHNLWEWLERYEERDTTPEESRARVLHDLYRPHFHEGRAIGLTNDGLEAVLAFNRRNSHA